jgi:hypothetical protein
MARHHEIQHIIEQLHRDADPVTAMRCLVIQSGGHWADVNDNDLFEINFLGIAGFGYGAADAVAKWIENAQRINAVDTAA